MEVHLRNASKHAIYGLLFARYGEDVGGPTRPSIRRWRDWRTIQARDFFRSRRVAPMRLADGRGVRIEAEDTCSIEAAFPSERRGLYRFDSLLVRTSYPFGLFWASKRVMVGAEYYVYPKPAGTGAWPGLQPGAEGGSPNSPRPGDDFRRRAGLHAGGIAAARGLEGLRARPADVGQAIHRRRRIRVVARCGGDGPDGAGKRGCRNWRSGW